MKKIWINEKYVLYFTQYETEKYIETDEYKKKIKEFEETAEYKKIWPFQETPKHILEKISDIKKEFLKTEKRIYKVYIMSNWDTINELDYDEVRLF